MRRKRHYWTILLASLAFAAPAAAEDQAICDDLHGQMADIAETIGTTRELHQYQTAIANQTFEIRKVLNDLRDNECSSGSVVAIHGDGNDSCGRIEETLQHMQQQLRDLLARRDAVRRGDSAGGVTRNQLFAALQANHCDDPTLNDSDTVITNHPDAALDGTPAATPSVTFMDKSGGPSASDETAPAPPPSYALGQGFGGHVRTVCVRTCDGGFFPMTPNATAGDFQRDADTCAKMCPDVKTELFFHRLPEQETSAMISASSGAPYSSMPYAFAYKKRPPNEKSSCSCNLPAYYEEMRKAQALSRPDSGAQAQPGDAQGSITTIPSPAPQATTPASRAAAAAPPQTPPSPERPYDPSTDHARQVGPQFLSTDDSKIDLRHPAGPSSQPEQ